MLEIILFSRKFVIPIDTPHIYRAKTLDPTFKGVFLDYLTKILYENERNYKNFTFKICPEHIMPSFVVAYARKNLYLIPEINKQIEAFKSNGLIGFWIKQYTSYKHNYRSASSHPSQLKFVNLQGAFEILIYGLVIAFAIFIIELLVRIVRKIFNFF